ncbi:Hypothetical predicted protein, partial [Mytilus galloprovincialis]
MWTKDAEKVDTAKIRGTKMLITNASVTDEGLYVCTLEPNKIMSKYYLIVIEPVITIYVQKGGDQDLGKPVKTHAEWTHNGKPMKSTKSVLCIHEASVDNEGLYLCTFGLKRKKITFNL